jgi:acetyl-CoA acetyltransferase
MKANPSYRYGLATLCVGFGQGNATLWERVS